MLTYIPPLQDVWLTRNGHGRMLDFFRGGTVPARKFELLSAALIRLVDNWIIDPHGRQLLAAFEDYLENPSNEEALWAYLTAFLNLPYFEEDWSATRDPNEERFTLGSTLERADDPTFLSTRLVTFFGPNFEDRPYSRADSLRSNVAIIRSLHARATGCIDTIDAVIAALIRDIFGNPFKPTVLDPQWLTPTVTSLAASIYDQRAFDRMPVLGDAFEEAGCTDAPVLAHCRSGQEHVRGCHVVDLILGKQ